MISILLATAGSGLAAAAPSAKIVYQHGAVYTVDRDGTVARPCRAEGS
jgi:hypothetical protein